jgi:hypothetical protein
MINSYFNNYPIKPEDSLVEDFTMSFNFYGVWEKIKGLNLSYGLDRLHHAFAQILKKESSNFFLVDNRLNIFNIKYTVFSYQFDKFH